MVMRDEGRKRGRKVGVGDWEWYLTRDKLRAGG